MKNKTVFKRYYLKKVVQETVETYSTTINSPDIAHKIVEEIFELSSLTKEHFVMLSLSTKNKVIGAHIVHIGSVNASIVHPRDVYQLALMDNASSIMVAHNHPSGDESLSQEDINVTRRLVEAGKMIGVELLDHIVVGSNNKFESFKEKGYL